MDHYLAHFGAFWSNGWRHRPALVLCAGLWFLGASCRRSDAPIVIGIAGPFSEARGRSMLLAARLAVQEINASNMLGGRPLELDSLDDAASPARAIGVAQQLRDDPRVVAVIGHLTSGTTIAAADIYNGGPHPVVAISPSASNPDLSGIGKYTFRVCATDLAHGGELARFAVQQLHANAVAVLYLNDDYGRGILATFHDEFAKLGGVITEADPLLAGTADLGPYLDHINFDDRAQVLMIAGDRATGVTVLHQARAHGIILPIMGGDGLSGIQAEGALAEGVHFTSNWLPDLPGEAVARFVRAYTAISGGALPDHRGAGAYDAVYLIAAAIRDAGTDRASIRDALARVGRGRPRFDGVTGPITFDNNGDVPGKAVYVGVVQNGRIALVGSR